MDRGDVRRCMGGDGPRLKGSIVSSDTGAVEL